MGVAFEGGGGLRDGAVGVADVEVFLLAEEGGERVKPGGVMGVSRGRTGEKRALPDFQKQSGVVCWGGEQIPPP